MKPAIATFTLLLASAAIAPAWQPAPDSMLTEWGEKRHPRERLARVPAARR